MGNKSTTIVEIKNSTEQMSTKSTTLQSNNMVVEPITSIRENDIVLGRKGFALKHRGNQAYRKLVNMNKELYATCQKRKKIRITKSIVAAMRVNGGRFLQRVDGKTSMTPDEVDGDGNPVVYFDIGDKKAIEKTSQALREGQPKLLQRIAARRQREAAQTAFTQLQQNHFSSLEPQSPVFCHTSSSSVTNSSLSATNFASIPSLRLERRRSRLIEPMPLGLSDPFKEPIEPLPLGRLNRLPALSHANQLMSQLPPPTIPRGGGMREVTPASIKSPVSRPTDLLQQYETNELLMTLIDRLQQR